MNRYKIFFLLAVVLLASCKSPFKKTDPSEHTSIYTYTCDETGGWCLINADYSYYNADKYEMGDAVITSKVNAVDVDWIFGSVKVAYGDGDELRCTEQIDNPNDTSRMRYWLDGTTLKVKFCKPGKYELKLREKDLTILLPKSAKQNIQIHTMSADVTVEGISVKKIDVETSSGGIELDEVTALNLDLESVSGDVKLSKVSADKLDLKTCSGNEEMISCNIKDVDLESISGEVSMMQNVFIQLDVETSSGNVDAGKVQGGRCDVQTICGNISVSGEVKHMTELETSSGDIKLCDFKSGSYSIETVSGDVTLYTSEKNLAVSFRTVSGDFNSSTPFTKDGDVYKIGNGSVMFDVVTASGDVSVK